MRFADFDPKRIDVILPPIPKPAPRVFVWTERQWTSHWLRESPRNLPCAGLYTWEPAPTIYVRGGPYTRLMDLTYAHEQGHHLWRYGLSPQERLWWSRWARGNPSLVPRRRVSEHWHEETFAEAFGRYFTGRKVDARTVRRLREVCRLGAGAERLPAAFATERREVIEAQRAFDW